MDAQAKIEMDDRAVDVTGKIMEIIKRDQPLKKQQVYHCIFTALQEQDVSARKRVAEAFIRELESICERA